MEWHAKESSEPPAVQRPATVHMQSSPVPQPKEHYSRSRVWPSWSCTKKLPLLATTIPPAPNEILASSLTMCISLSDQSAQWYSSMLQQWYAHAQIKFLFWGDGKRQLIWIPSSSSCSAAAVDHFMLASLVVHHRLSLLFIMIFLLLYVCILLADHTSKQQSLLYCTILYDFCM